MRIKIIALLFLTFSVQCQNSRINDISGSWAWEHNSEKREFSLDIKLINNTFYGSYCAIRNSGMNTDCAVKLDTINYNFKINPSNQNQYKFKFNYNGNYSYGGIARLKLLDKNRILWLLDTLASPNAQVPDSAVLTRVSYNKNVIIKTLVEDSLKKGNKSKSDYIYIKEKDGIKYASIKIKHFTINSNELNQKVKSNIKLSKCVQSQYEMDGSIHKYNTCKYASNTIYTSEKNEIIGASIIDELLIVDNLNIKVGDGFQNTWNKLGQPKVKNISKSIKQVHIVIENSETSKSAYFEFKNDLLTKIYVFMDEY